jgi:hypothetical protein
MHSAPMGPALYLIAILGCGESDAPCQEVRVVETRYQSEAACTAATTQAIEANLDLAFPSVVAQCRRADAAPRAIPASEVMLPESQPNPLQDRRGPAIQIARLSR